MVVDVSYLGVASAYVIANVTSLISHVPGGLGVIENVVAFLLPRADLIGALVAFRFIYFLLPCAGRGLFVVTEARCAREAAGRRRGQNTEEVVSCLKLTAGGYV